MILTGEEIRRQRRSGRIEMNPFNPQQLNPNSYDLTMGTTVGRYKEAILDASVENAMAFHEMGPGGEVIEPGKIVLGHTVEVFGSDHFVPIVRAKSSVARLGLFIHVTADLVDIGWHGQLTLQLHAVQPLRVYPGMLVAQITFWVPKGEIGLYDGKYQHSTGPVASRMSARHLEAKGETP
ncbi:dCTP deaminase [Clavibacter sp. VKM Ac-2872]|uniref:dCTP deaminase n=1 Tax=Clavibacter sp. VKM Ac-2872 TaxID=2783812 RepID=UPI00188BC23E|nr:dCTP deaminase [Clavibacter sp. VKM Ac-2872]